ncbi:MAG: radical SAM protein [Deltaproteobacteria bacterium]|nr:radical SAM protein [Deltaproteobacteria bacterium]
MERNDGKKIALVGRRLSGNENLGLGYLTTALQNAGHRVQVEYINRGDDLQRIVRAITSDSFFMVGISLSDGGSSFLPLALGEMLHRRGYKGHITAGGHFATLTDGWLLERYHWLDSVVRFAGEVPVVELAKCVETGGDFTVLPGVRTRLGPGLPAPVFDNTPMEIWPTRDVRPEIIGYGVAQVSATRGCKGRCTYCGPAAIQSREKSEALAIGASREDIARCGVGGVRRRDLNDLCDEMAELWHKSGVRYFYLVDEHLLPYEEAAALDYLDTWRHGLERRKVGRFGIGLMLRAERITQAIIERFKQVGLVRAFIALELATPKEGTAFGRKINPEHNLRILETFNRLGMETVSNLMLVHPYSTTDTIASGLEYLKRIRTGLFETTRMMPYHGTRLADRLRKEGRIDGNPLRYGYGFEDPTVTRFVQSFARLRAKSFRDYSLAYYAHDVFVSMVLARHLFPERRLGALSMRVERLREQINRTYVDAYEAAFKLASEGGDSTVEDRLVAFTTKRVRTIQAQLAEVDAELNVILAGSVKRYSPLAGAAAAVFAFSIMGGALNGCYQSTSRNEDGGAETDKDTDTDTKTGADADADTDIDADTDTDADTDVDTDIDTDIDTDTDTDTDDECSVQKENEQRERVVEAVDAEVPCFDGTLYFEQEGAITARAAYSSGIIKICDKEDLRPLEEAAEKAAQEAEHNCILGNVYVEDGLREDYQRMEEAAYEACSMELQNEHDFVVHLDDQGFVSDVIPAGEDPAEKETAACVLEALKGLQFPCLSNFDICPEYLIAE